LENAVKHQTIIKNSLFTAIAFAIAQPALAVTDEEFHTLQEQFNQLAEQVDTNSKTSTSDTSIGGYGELQYANLSNDAGDSIKELSSSIMNSMTKPVSSLNLRSSMLQSRIIMMVQAILQMVKLKSNRLMYNLI